MLILLCLIFMGIFCIGEIDNIELSYGSQTLNTLGRGKHNQLKKNISGNVIDCGSISMYMSPNETANFRINGIEDNVFLEFSMDKSYPIYFQSPSNPKEAISRKKHRIISKSSEFSLWNVGTSNGSLDFDVLRVYELPNNVLNIFDTVENKTFEYLYKQEDESDSIMFEFQSLSASTSEIWLCILYEQFLNFEPTCVLFEITPDFKKGFTLKMDAKETKIVFFAFPNDSNEILTYSLKLFPIRSEESFFFNNPIIWIVVGLMCLCVVCVCICIIFAVIILLNICAIGYRCSRKGLIPFGCGCPFIFRFYRSRSNVHLGNDMTEEINNIQKLDTDTKKLEDFLPSHNENEYEKRRKTIPDGETCCICMDYPRGVIFLPCRHFGVCEFCTKAVMESSGKCPLCRAEIESTLIKKYDYLTREKMKNEILDSIDYVKNPDKKEVEEMKKEVNSVVLPVELDVFSPSEDNSKGTNLGSVAKSILEYSPSLTRAMGEVEKYFGGVKIDFVEREKKEKKDRREGFSIEYDSEIESSSIGDEDESFEMETIDGTGYENTRKEVVRDIES